MIKNSFVIAELNVPRSPEAINRTYGFYNGIGWNTRPHSTDPNAVYAHPYDRGNGPVVVYWHTDNASKINRFVMNDEESPSKFSKGLRHPAIQELTELVLIVPDELSVVELFERGGDLLEAHAHIPPREHAGALEFRFTDPFNNALRVAADPGYEI